MNEPDDPRPDTQPPISEPTRLVEARQIIKEYADELLEIIRKLRHRLHEGRV